MKLKKKSIVGRRAVKAETYQRRKQHRSAGSSRICRGCSSGVSWFRLRCGGGASKRESPVGAGSN